MQTTTSQFKHLVSFLKTKPRFVKQNNLVYSLVKAVELHNQLALSTIVSSSDCFVILHVAVLVSMPERQCFLTILYIGNTVTVHLIVRQSKKSLF